MKPPVVWVFAHCKNEAEILPFFLRHYSAFSDQIHIFDDCSDDGTVELLKAHPKVVYHPINMGGIDEDALLQLAYDNYPLALDHADYVMWPDMDEFIYHPRMLDCLAHFKDLGYDACRTLGFNMMGDGLPVDDGKSQIWQLMPMGVRAPVYSKPVIFNPKCRIGWSRGKHSLACPGMSISPWENEYKPHPWRLRLLHYRYLGLEYTTKRNARQYARSVEKGAAWSNAPDREGEHTPQWAHDAQRLAYDVTCDDACYRPPGQDA